MTAVFVCAAALLFGTVVGIVIGAHLAAAGRIVGRARPQDAEPTATATALPVTPAAAVAAVLRDHAALAAVLREVSAAPAPPSPAALPSAVPSVRQVPGGEH